MEYHFRDLDNNSMYDSCHVMYVLGSYDIFNNMVIDRLRKIAIPAELEDNSSAYLQSIMEDFNVSTVGDKTDNSMNTLSFDEFIASRGSYPIRGKWYCNVNYSELNKKRLDDLNEYIKHSSGSGILVVVSRDYFEYRNITKSRLIKNSKNVHMIQLSFPDRSKLSEIIRKKLEAGGVKANDKAIQLFILRLSNAYNDYDKVLSNIIDEYSGKSIGYDEMLESLRGIENYVLDDFIEQLTVGVKNVKIVKSRKIYKMYRSLLEEMSPETLVKKVASKVDIMLEMRRLINNGTIPVLVKYSATKIQEKLPDDSKLKSLSSKAFKRNALIASKTSLEDWFFMKMILQGNPRCMGKYKSDAEYRHILIELMHRNIASPDRLLNDIGIKNVLDENLFSLNTILYDESIQMSADAMNDIITKNKEFVDAEAKEHKEYVNELFRFGRKKKKNSDEAKKKKSKPKKSSDELVIEPDEVSAEPEYIVDDFIDEEEDDIKVNSDSLEADAARLMSLLGNQ